jgi:anthranilate phosphoribosyltransferase
MRALIERVVRGEELPRADMAAAVEHMLSGEGSPAQIAALLVALRMRGETAAEITAAAEVMRARATPVDLGLAPGTVLLDTCGTGGDGASTFNLSTMAALVAASAGVKVVKHGNRAVSSRAGSADVLELLGVPLEAPPERIAACVRDAGIGFFFAPQFHAAVRHVMPVRRELGLRTIFNLLGPLSNPARATHQLLGVYDPALVSVLAEALRGLGVSRAWVVHGEGGLDEISHAGETRVAELANGVVREFTVSPADAGLALHPLASIAGGTAADNAVIARDVLSGVQSAYFDAVVLNGAAALVVAERAADLREGASLARDLLVSGKTSDMLDRWARAMAEAP